MFDGSDDHHPISQLLAGSRHFVNPEPVGDIADTASDLYLTLARTIEREVVPRLLLKTRAVVAGPEVTRAVAALETAPDVVAFCKLILTADVAEAEDFVAAEIAAGVPPERLLLEVFAPTARRLGELWESDECTFVDVTIALGRLQQILRLFSETYRSEPDQRKLGFRAFLTTVPDSQHVFGMYVVEELFRRAGWNVLSLAPRRRSEILEAVRQEWFAVVGLSISCVEPSEPIADLIADIRAASLNRSIVILVGGRYVTENPARAAQLGADLVGPDAQVAIERSQIVLKSIGR